MDISGREVYKLVDDVFNSGIYETEFDGSNFSSGIYFYEMQSDNFMMTKRMLLIK